MTKNKVYWYLPLTPNHQSPITNHQSRVTCHQARHEQAFNRQDLFKYFFSLPKKVPKKSSLNFLVHPATICKVRKMSSALGPQTGILLFHLAALAVSRSRKLGQKIPALPEITN